MDTSLRMMSFMSGNDQQRPVADPELPP